MDEFDLIGDDVIDSRLNDERDPVAIINAKLFTSKPDLMEKVRENAFTIINLQEIKIWSKMNTNTIEVIYINSIISHAHGYPGYATSSENAYCKFQRTLSPKTSFYDPICSSHSRHQDELDTEKEKVSVPSQKQQAT